MNDFEFYTDEYGGCEITDSEEFERFAKKARLFISRVTSGEVDFEDEDVKSCVCALCEVYQSNNSLRGIKSERIDDYEVEYASENADNILMHTVRLYLPPVLLYRGF